MLKSLEINGFKSFANKSQLNFDAPISAIVGPNGSGKSNAAEAFRFVLGEQSLKALRARNSDELLYNGGQKGRRRNRASVKAVFNNSKNLLDIDYEEVIIERIIERGDASTYRINGSQVRLKDVIDLLSDANIGTSRHHIISQGESDRILNVHERERKSMIEDALGLRRFYRQRREAVQKLERTQDNLSEIQTRRQDLLPELKFLKKQKSRIEKTKKLRERLRDKYQRFFKRESVLLSHRESNLKEKITELTNKKSELEDKITKAKKNLETNEVSQDEEKKSNEITQIEKDLKETEQKIAKVNKEQGQVEGKLETLKAQQKKQRNSEPKIMIANSRFVEHKNNFTELLNKADKINDESSKAELFEEIAEAVRTFLSDVTESKPDTSNYQNDITDLENQQKELKEKQNTLEKRKTKLQKRREEVQKNKKEQESKQHKTEKELLQLSGTYENITAELERVREQQSDIKSQQEQLADEKSEARVMCGKEALETENIPLVDAAGNEVTKDELIDSSNRKSRREFSRQLERLKIKLEDTRVSDQKEVLDEFDRVQSQVSFLENEIQDLQESKDSLLTLIEDIETTVAEKFDQGVKAINKAFCEFFQTMFGGGKAELFITKHPKGRKGKVDDLDEEPEEIERGIDIDVQLPNKKVRGLGVLSGGERSLVSIALLFALSQINPPPFVVLDEADAALDEANSRRFGDMIESLSERSQLIVITHNRETMSRADVLYGVTMDQSGGSRLLSLNFSEAVDTVEV